MKGDVLKGQGDILKGLGELGGLNECDKDVFI